MILMTKAAFEKTENYWTKNIRKCTKACSLKKIFFLLKKSSTNKVQ